MNRVLITKPINQLCGMNVCAVDDATDEEILAICNTENRSGTDNGWIEVVRDDSRDTHCREGESLAPVACASFPGRTHYTILC